ncbi:type II toxin-antitoxin system VapC family toxin [Nocardia sp. CA-129566]|uniref:type II toxin-antitoxin system VapC family toxin n=1 Tax=Nocardia sp. CA-129566 TaxID=3239976 RepID=UPI003D95114A
MPSPVLAEVCYFLETRVGPQAEAIFLESIANQEIELVELTRADLSRMAELVRKYSDFPLGAVDAAVLAVAERLEVAEVATLDLRHFSAVRTRHPSPLRLLPS